MVQRFSIELGYDKNATLNWYLRSQPLIDYIKSLQVFDPDATSYDILNPRINTKTRSGNQVEIEGTFIRYHFVGSLDLQQILEGMSSAISTAKKLEGAVSSLVKPSQEPLKIAFNPNLLIFNLEHIGPGTLWDSLGNIEKLALKLQAILYGDGNVMCTLGLGYRLYFGTDENVMSEFVKGHSYGFNLFQFERKTTKPANSLDELLARLEQK